MNDIKIRLITDADNSAIAEIIRTNLKKFNLDIPGTAYFDPELNCLSKYYSALPKKRAYFITEGDDKQIIGGVGIAEFEKIDCCAEIQKLYLADAAKGKGLGRMLMQTAENFAKERNYKKLYLETHSDLTAAIRLYERLGFKEIERPPFVIHTTMDRFYIKEL
mgnify:CR=1 FL=1